MMDVDSLLKLHTQANQMDAQQTPPLLLPQMANTSTQLQTKANQMDAQQTPPLPPPQMANTATQLQTKANQMDTQVTPPLPPQMVSTATQSLTWNELTLQMISDVVSHQVIHMSKQEEEPPHTQLTSHCQHLKAMTWKDITNMVLSSHDTLCTETGVKLTENLLQVTVEWPPSFIDYVRTSIEIHFPSQTKPDVGSVDDQLSYEQDDNVGERDDVVRVSMCNLDEMDALTSNQKLISNMCNTSQEDHTTLEITENLDELDASTTKQCHQSSLEPISNVCNSLQKDHTTPEITENRDEKLDVLTTKQSHQTSLKPISNLCNSLQKDHTTPEMTENCDEKLDALTTKLSHQTSLKPISNLCNSLQKYHTTPALTEMIDTCGEALLSTVEVPNIHHENVMSYCDEKPKVETQDGDYVIFSSVPKSAQYDVKDDNQSKLTINEPTVLEISIVKGPEAQNVRESKITARPKCEDCSQLFSTLGQLKHHIRTHSKQSVKKQSGFKCEVCKKVFQSSWKLSKHKPIHTPGYDMHPCQHCDKICKTSASLKMHQRIHKEPHLYSCNKCSISFRAQVKLKQHMTKVHNVIDRYECTICGAVYKNKTTLKDHVVEHSGKEFLCDICGKKFLRPELLRCHRFRHSMQNKPKCFNCSVCPKVYATDAQLKVHIRLTHMKERDNVCKICKKTFFYRYQMVAHEKSHLGIMPHTCKYCNKGFLKKVSLETHKMVHTGDKPYNCTHCLKSFATKAHKARHELQLHTDAAKPERAIQCNVCNAKFRYKGQCKEHEKRHAGVKDHNCRFCSKSFVSRGDLLRHLRTHTDGKPHECLHCDMAFTKRKDLSAHEVSHDS